MNPGEDNHATVTILEAKPLDVGRGVARIDPSVAAKLGLIAGDAILIEGSKTTGCLIWPGYAEDLDKNVIRLDNIARRNAGASIDEKVQIRKTNMMRATRVELSPVEELRIVDGEEYLLRFLERRVVTLNDIIEFSIMGRKVDLAVTHVEPENDVVIINEDTALAISDTPWKGEEKKILKISYDDIGGLNHEIKQVREMIELPLKHPELFEKIGVEAPKGVLLHGPPGTGKTLIAKAVAGETNANFFSLGGPEIMSKFYGQSEENLRQIFREAAETAPSIIFIDEIDSIAPKRSETSSDVERRVVAQLLALMDGLQERGRVVVIGATNRINSLDEALRRPGRFDREIEIGMPDYEGRKDILTIHMRGMPLQSDVDIDNLASITHGYSGADLAALCKEGAMRALRAILPLLDLGHESIPRDVLEKIAVGESAFYEAFQTMAPSTLREVVIESTNTHWDDIGGIEQAKQLLRESVEWPLKYGEVFHHFDARPPKGILLYGPPGTGKTMLAKAVANESEANFISVKGPEFLSKWVGESEKAVRETFRKARQAAPCIVFLDELDAIASVRKKGGDNQAAERLISQLVTELDGLEELRGVTVLAATNRPDLIDPALLRPGRFDRAIYIPAPDTAGRKKILEVHTRKKPLNGDVDLDALSMATENYTGADLAALANEAIMDAIREYVTTHSTADAGGLSAITLHKRHFDRALAMISPQPKEVLDAYRSFSESLRK